MVSGSPSVKFNGAPPRSVTRSTFNPLVSRTTWRAPAARSMPSVAEPASVFAVKSAVRSSATCVTRASQGRAYEWMSRSAGMGSVMDAFPVPELHAAATTATSPSHRGVRMESWGPLSAALGVWAALRGPLMQGFRQAHEVGEHPIRARHSGRQLPEPRVRRVDVAPLANVGVHLAATLQILA